LTWASRTVRLSWIDLATSPANCTSLQHTPLPSRRSHTLCTAPRRHRTSTSLSPRAQAAQTRRRQSHSRARVHAHTELVRPCTPSSTVRRATRSTAARATTSRRRERPGARAGAPGPASPHHADAVPLAITGGGQRLRVMRGRDRCGAVPNNVTRSPSCLVRTLRSLVSHVQPSTNDRFGSNLSRS
jgi:hypothetical protein